VRVFFISRGAIVEAGRTDVEIVWPPFVRRARF